MVEVGTGVEANRCWRIKCSAKAKAGSRYRHARKGSNEVEQEPAEQVALRDNYWVRDDIAAGKGGRRVLWRAEQERGGGGAIRGSQPEACGRWAGRVPMRDQNGTGGWQHVQRTRGL